MTRRAITRAISGLLVAWIAACGGRVDGVSSSSGASGGSAGTPTAQPPSGTGRPGRTPPQPVTPASVGSQIAEAYCKAFSSCCVGSGQPPIDVARCRELTSASVAQDLSAIGMGSATASEVALCVAAIHDRTAACGNEDVRWPGPDPLLAPASIQKACQSVFGAADLPSSEPCSKTAPCGGAQTCAVDECSSAPGIGAPCPGGVCLDSAQCRAGSCGSGSTQDVGAACATDLDCRVGLVCFKGQCAPAREHPELYEPRSSPYRIGADTCRAYTYL